MNMGDPVVWGSFGAVAICLVIVIFLANKVKSLIAKDAESHKK